MSALRSLMSVQTGTRYVAPTPARKRYPAVKRTTDANIAELVKAAMARIIAEEAAEAKKAEEEESTETTEAVAEEAVGDLVLRDKLGLEINGVDERAVAFIDRLVAKLEEIRHNDLLMPADIEMTDEEVKACFAAKEYIGKAWYAMENAYQAVFMHDTGKKKVSFFKTGAHHYDCPTVNKKDDMLISLLSRLESGNPMVAVATKEQPTQVMVDEFNKAILAKAGKPMNFHMHYNVGKDRFFLMWVDASMDGGERVELPNVDGADLSFNLGD